jgi:hypothetical protein
LVSPDEAFQILLDLEYLQKWAKQSEVDDLLAQALIDSGIHSTE